LDFGKFQYEQEKSKSKNKVKSKAGEIKEIQFGTKTDEHDFNTKIEQAKKFISKGYKIRVTVKMVGRENIYSDRALAQIERVKSDLGTDYEQRPLRFGTRFSATLIKSKIENKKEVDNAQVKDK
jgi:translation initiation factor IF-3